MSVDPQGEVSEKGADVRVIEGGEISKPSSKLMGRSIRSVSGTEKIGRIVGYVG